MNFKICVSKRNYSLLVAGIFLQFGLIQSASAQQTELKLFSLDGTDKCIQAGSRTPDIGVQIKQRACNGYKTQKWVFQEVSTNIFIISNIKNKLCIDVSQGIDTTVVQNDCNPNKGSQQFNRSNVLGKNNVFELAHSSNQLLSFKQRGRRLTLSQNTSDLTNIQATQLDIPIVVDPPPPPAPDQIEVTVSNFEITHTSGSFVYFSYDAVGTPSSDTRWYYQLYRRNGDDRPFEKVGLTKSDYFDRVAETFVRSFSDSPLRQCFKMEIYGYFGYGDRATSYRSNVSNTVCYTRTDRGIPLHSIALSLSIDSYSDATREISFSWAEEKGEIDPAGASFYEENMSTGEVRFAHPKGEYVPGSQRATIKLTNSASGIMCYKLRLCQAVDGPAFGGACGDYTNIVCIDVP